MKWGLDVRIWDSGVFDTIMRLGLKMWEWTHGTTGCGDAALSSGRAIFSLDSWSIPADNGSGGQDTMTRLGRRVRVLTGYAAHARFSAECGSEFAGEIPTEIQQPYASSPSHVVWQWGTQPVVIVETRHRRYEVFAVTGPIDPLNTY